MPKIRFACTVHKAELVYSGDGSLLVQDQDDLSWQFDLSEMYCPILEDLAAVYDENHQLVEVDYDKIEEKDRCRLHPGGWVVILD